MSYLSIPGVAAPEARRPPAAVPIEAPTPARPPERPASPEPSAVPPAPEARPAPERASRRLRLIFLVTLLVAGAAAVTAAAWRGRPNPEDLAEQANVEQTAWRNYLRYAPLRLTGGFATGTLAPGDGVSPDDRLEDYYAFEIADSSAFSVIATASDFAPDLVVTTPSGRRIAASALWQTPTRAEVPGLRGPGRYVIAVTTREARAGGAYELSAGPPPLPRLVAPEDDAVDSTLGLAGAPRAGRYEDHYAVVAPAGQSVLIAVRSKTFRPRLALLGPQGLVAEPWGTPSRLDTDTLHTAALRYQPGWDSPYLLIVSSEEEGKRGDYTVEVDPVRVLAIATDGTAASGTLGEGGWYRDGRYADTYRFEAAEGTAVLAEVRSEKFAPALVLRQGERVVARAEGGSDGGAVRLSHDLDGGTYELDVTSVDADATGDYTVAVTVDAPEGPRTQAFGTEARRVGTTVRGHTFEVTVRRVSVTPAGEGRVQVRLRIEERSLDFEGEWDEWPRRAARTRLTDDTGRVYHPVDFAGGQDGDAVAPGEARRGEIVYEAVRAGGRPETLTLLYPIGVNGAVVVAIPIALER